MADPKDERIAALEQELARCNRDGQRLAQLLAEEEDDTDALKEALRALVAVEPTWWDDLAGEETCCYCGPCQWPPESEHLAHAPDCPWVEAKALLAEMQNAPPSAR